MVTVRRATAPPHYLSNKGPVPAGVYVRQGTSSVQVSRPAILKMIKATDKDIYEEELSHDQNLTFQEADKVFADKAIPFDENHKVSLGIKNFDGAYTNLGLLLSDQNQHVITIGVFQEKDVSIQRDRIDFSGSLLKQLEDTDKFIDFRNATAAEFKGLSRIDIRDYPPEAVREVILNLLMHRDHSCPYNTQIKIFSDRIEFVSFGSLPEGLTMELMESGISMPRNRKLAEIFLWLKFIERMGLGIQKIKDGYKDYNIKPDFFTDEVIFRVILPNINEARLDAKGRRDFTPGELMEANEQDILNLFKTKKYITRKDVEDLIPVSRTSANTYLNILIKKGVIASTGRARSTKYYLSRKEEKSN